ncbi:hypothetical protein TIFTF001_002709 [Ficus carica]|uniref:Uncharacterized protein n=1 Tax=Ficus carica TaxID=3494 RepID=A0AA87ZCS0_FICCA|nr:hypothetical protein TIFTF001_002709 [Ficus carica]
MRVTGSRPAGAGAGGEEERGEEREKRRERWRQISDINEDLSNDYRFKHDGR